MAPTPPRTRTSPTIGSCASGVETVAQLALEPRDTREHVAFLEEIEARDAPRRRPAGWP